MPVKLVQFGDPHLDGAFAGLSPRAAAVVRQRRRALLGEVVRLANNEKADLLICTGDLFDSQTPYADTLDAAAAAFSRAEMPVFVAPGNHDWYDSKSPYASARWSANVHIFKGQLETVALESPGCRVTGFGYTERNPAGRFLEGYRETQDDLINILAAHGELKQSRDGQYAVATHADVTAAGFDYAAFGHIHDYSAVKLGHTLAVVNGGLCARGFDEYGEKGAVVARVEKRYAEARLVPLGGERCHSAEILCTAEDTVEAVARKITENCPYPSDRVFLRVTLSGQAAPRLRDVEAALSAFLSVRIEDKTKKAEPLFARAGEDSLAGLFIGNMKKKIEAAGAEEKALLETALYYGLAALDGREQPAAREVSP